MEFVKDNKTYILAKDQNKKDVTNHEVHDVLFKILLEFDRVCRKNNVSYALAFGSALGLYNYGDFIPWDDDMDIAIDYFDRFKLIEALEKDLCEDFSFECYERDDRYHVLIPGMKIRYKHSDIKEKNHFRIPNKLKNGNGLFIDIVFLMGVPSDSKKHHRLLKKAEWVMPWFCFLDAFLHINPKGIKKKLKQYENKVAEEYKDSDTIGQSVIMPFQVFPKRKYHHISYPKEVIYPFKEYDFRGHKIYSFNKLEEFCVLMYGSQSLKVLKDNEYFDLYPLEKRKSDHLLRVDIFKK